MFQSLEASFHQDLNGDGTIGIPSQSSTVAAATVSGNGFIFAPSANDSQARAAPTPRKYRTERSPQGSWRTSRNPESYRALLSLSSMTMDINPLFTMIRSAISSSITELPYQHEVASPRQSPELRLRAETGWTRQFCSEYDAQTAGPAAPERGALGDITYPAWLASGCDRIRTRVSRDRDARNVAIGRCSRRSCAEAAYCYIRNR